VQGWEVAAVVSCGGIICLLLGLGIKWFYRFDCRDNCLAAVLGFIRLVFTVDKVSLLRHCNLIKIVVTVIVLRAPS